MSQLSLTEGNVRRALSRFAIPFLGASLLQFLYGAVDLIVVGQFADQAGIAAVSTGSQVMQAVTNFIIGLSTGGTVLVGQYLEARRGGRKPGHRHPVFPLCPHRRGPGGRLRPVHQRHCGADAGARRGGGTRPAVPVYLRLRPGVHHRIQYGQRRAPGPGDSKRPMYFVLVACIINIVGDLLLVGVFGLGAAGPPSPPWLPRGEPGPGPGGTPPPGLPL